MKKRDQNMVLNLLRYHHRDKYIYMLVTVYYFQYMKSGGAHVFLIFHVLPTGDTLSARRADLVLPLQERRIQ